VSGRLPWRGRERRPGDVPGTLLRCDPLRRGQLRLQRRMGPTGPPGHRPHDPRGEFIGICGPTGGGKSTLVDLLVGLLQPTAGADHASTAIPLGRRPDWWWAQLGVVSQQVFLTDDTLRNNIAFGDQERDASTRIDSRAASNVRSSNPSSRSSRWARHARRRARGPPVRRPAPACRDRPGALPRTGGPRPRRGHLRLDGATERALVAAIDEATHERTLIAIAHRISTIRDADRILVVADGRIQDIGTHDELLARSELFRALA
jgi:ABC-type transport system involved in cytochrome bd biosynthesis fused ATPase/permease subunit